MKYIDLFCGIGGFHQALKRLDYECVMACDINLDCRKTYKINYGMEILGDIRNIEIDSIPEFDILCGGFPCQAFSLAGKKLSINDKRGDLFEYILKIMKIKKPKFIFLENVKHIRNIDNGNVFKYIIESVRELGYYIDSTKTIFELSPHELGIPQKRERLIFVGIRLDIYNPNNSIKIEKENPELNLMKILDKDIDNKYYISDELNSVLTIWDNIIGKMEYGENLSPTILCHEFYRNSNSNMSKWKKFYIEKNKRIYYKYKKEWDDWYIKNKIILNKKEIYGKLEWQVGKKKENDSIFNYFIQLRQSGIRVKRAIYFPTLVAYCQIPIYAKERRYLTPRECCRLQSFPDDFILPENDKTAYKQLGNAVNVEVIYKVISSTLKAYNYI
jgi:DNA (cytosine-5)-methyltransferase 1